MNTKAKSHSKPAVEVRAFADHEVILPKANLKSRAQKGSKADDDWGLDMEAIARAEAALVELAPEFDVWMSTECDRLEVGRRALTTGGLSKATVDVMFRAAHDIKGEAATFGYEIAGELAASLCRLILHTPAPALLPLELVDRHVEAIRAVVREDRKGTTDPVSLEVIDRLQDLTEAFLKDQHKDDPAWLAEHATPSLVPDQPLC